MTEYITLELINAAEPETAASIAKQIISGDIPGLLKGDVFVQTKMPSAPGREIPAPKFNVVACNRWADLNALKMGVQAARSEARNVDDREHFASLQLELVSSNGEPDADAAITSMMVCKVNSNEHQGIESFLAANAKAFFGFEGCVSSRVFGSLKEDSPFDFVVISTWTDMAAFGGAMQGTSHRGADPRSKQIDEMGVLLRPV